MDESTANLDHATDATIQSVLRTSLADTQMLVIAHRLLTVAGLDRILVLDHGKVVEYDTPWNLLQDENGVFRDLVRKSGEESQLFEVSLWLCRNAVGTGTHGRWLELFMRKSRLRGFVSLIWKKRIGGTETA